MGDEDEGGSGTEGTERKQSSREGEGALLLQLVGLEGQGRRCRRTMVGFWIPVCG